MCIINFNNMFVCNIFVPYIMMVTMCFLSDVANVADVAVEISDSSAHARFTSPRDSLSLDQANCIFVDLKLSEVR